MVAVISLLSLALPSHHQHNDFIIKNADEIFFFSCKKLVIKISGVCVIYMKRILLVFIQDFPEPELLLSPENVDQEALQRFTMEAVVFATDNRLPELEFALNHYSQPDVAVFDFTTMYASENACRAIQRKGHKLLIGLVGDALLEPFWPTGSGCARGFLASYDAAW